MQGEQEAAMNKYTDALHVYMDVTGKDHVSYAATLSNLGVLYKDMSKGRVVSRNNSDNTGGVDENDVVVVPVKGMEKLQLLERAEEALVEARDTRIRLLGKFVVSLIFFIIVFTAAPFSPSPFPLFHFPRFPRTT